MLVLTRAQAVDAGISAARVDAFVRSGRWLALRRGVYLAAPALPTDAAARHAVRVQAAVLASGGEVVGSHESAAVVHGLPLLQPYSGAPVLSRLRTAREARPDATRCARLVSQVPEHHRVQHLGAAVTSRARTAVDLARTRLPLTAVIVLDAALRLGVPRRELEGILDDQRGWPGSAVARGRVLFADGLAESPLESVGRLRMAQLGLPAPRLQVVLGGRTGPIARVDFAWPEHHTVGEADGAQKYAHNGPAHGAQFDSYATLYAEKQREDLLRDNGFEVFRFGWDEAVHRPQVIEDRARRAFARAATRRLSAASDVRRTG